MIINKIRLYSPLVIWMMVSFICIGLVSGAQAEKPYITIEPLGSTPIGDLLILSGTTDLPAGTELLIKVEGVQNANGVVVKGTNGLNRWSIPMDTTISKPGNHPVIVTEITGYNEDKTGYTFGDTTAKTDLVLTGTFLGSDTEVSGKNQENAFIKIDPIQNRKKGDQFLATGTTNLSVGTSVLWKVTPVNLKEMESGVLTGSMMNSQVTRGSGTNRITLAVDGNYLNPGEYNVTVSTIKGEIFDKSMTPGPTSDSAIFTLK